MANRAAGQLIRVEEPDSGGNLTETARYAYDAMGRMLTVQMGRKSDGTFKQTRTFVYNTAGQLTSSTTPEKGLVSYTYRTDGLVETKTEPAGTKQSPTTKTLMYNYDDKHRLTNVYRVNSPNNLTVLTAFAYDTDLWGFGGANTQGRMVLAMNWDPNKTYAWFFSYDVMGRVNKQSLQTPYLSNGNYLVAQATYGYDDDGNLTAIGYPGNLAPLASATQALNCTHAYDVIGRPTSYQCTDTNQITTTLANNATYNASGQLLSWQEGSSTLTRGYDVQRGWLTSLTAGAALNLGYAYYGNGQAKSVSDTVNGGQAVTSYTYDNLNRLYSAATPNWTLTYGYDEFGNRTSQHGTGSATSVEQTAVYDTAYTNQIVSSTTNGVGASYVYDAAGNMTSNGSQTIAYDSFNRPVTIGSAAMIYDGFGRRVEKTVNGQTYIYFYDARGRQIQTYVLSSGAAANVLHSFAGQRIGQWTDRVGSKRSDGSTISHYYPYGEEITGTANDTYKHAQTYRDGDSGLDYAMNRYYASGVGRFLTPDDYDGSENAMSPQSWSHYSYTQADPVNYRDRTGMLRAAVGEPCGAEWMWDASLAGPCDDDWDYDFYFLIGLAPIVRHSPSPPECSSGFVLASGGTPMFNQDVTQARNRPPTNTLGCYARQSKFSDPNAGWYCAVQLWVTYSGGTGATSWNLLQWVDHQGWEETTQYPGVHQPINESHSDNQLDPSFVRVSRGIASLIDLPGEGMYTTNGRYQVVNADIFYTFHTSLNVGRYPGTPLCDIDWQVHVVVTNKVGHAEVSIQ